MGLIKAALGAAGGVLADQWKDFFICEEMADDVLMMKGHRSTGGRSANTKGSDNVITNGSVIVVAALAVLVIFGPNHRPAAKKEEKEK